MAIGLMQKRAESMGGMLRNQEVAREYHYRFETRMKTTICRELTGMDLTTQEGIERFMASGVPRKVCFPAIAAAYRLVVDRSYRRNHKKMSLLDPPKILIRDLI